MLTSFTRNWGLELLDRLNVITAKLGITQATAVGDKVADMYTDHTYGHGYPQSVDMVAVYTVAAKKVAELIAAHGEDSPIALAASAVMEIAAAAVTGENASIRYLLAARRIIRQMETKTT